MRYAIHVFPQFDTIEKIQEIRRVYDPLANKIPPHITLVFPFESSIPPNELLSHIRSAADQISPFTIRLRDVSGSGGEYLFLNVKEGNDSLIRLHDELYKGILATFRNHHIPYIPHITLGRPGRKEDYYRGVERYKDWSVNFQTVVKEIALEVIGDDDVSTVIGSVPLHDNRF